MAPETKPQLAQPPAPLSPTGLIFRLTWMAGGNIALALTAFVVMRAGIFSWRDVAYWIIVVLLVLVRYIDVTRLGGLTADGQPASLRHWRRYTATLLGAAGLAWALAHVVGRLAVV